MTVDLAHAFALAREPDAAARVFGYAVAGIGTDAGSLLTTASTYDLPGMRSRRVFTQDPVAYPLGNFKRLERNRYFDTVIVGKQAFSSTTIAEIATVFFDWEKIQALGYESNMNLPAIADDAVIGSVNLLHRRGHFTATRVAAAMAWQPVVTLAFLLLGQTGDDMATFEAGAAGDRNAPGRLEG